MEAGSSWRLCRLAGGHFILLHFWQRCDCEQHCCPCHHLHCLHLWLTMILRWTLWWVRRGRRWLSLLLALNPGDFTLVSFFDCNGNVLTNQTNPMLWLRKRVEGLLGCKSLEEWKVNIFSKVTYCNLHISALKMCPSKGPGWLQVQDVQGDGRLEVSDAARGGRRRESTLHWKVSTRSWLHFATCLDMCANLQIYNFIFCIFSTLDQIEGCLTGRSRSQTICELVLAAFFAS